MFARGNPHTLTRSGFKYVPQVCLLPAIVSYYQGYVIRCIRIIPRIVFNAYLTVLNVPNDRMTHPCILHIFAA
jgi:hypothetical protein